ncbi:sulfur carrier protein ThiS [Myroides pelagicus]|uniref:Sulfur carrier protein ThiS n=1 Tax=Myroides pelagicus TaxID=270914 RepID=A0A7K1GLA4_9FLAO|nr:sulfur carrier protein ThiS [Myroides pelagicus]MEC4112602.1 sulfur carrier protein ThiS [Myroides pelagicus]MTH29520.1 sulfur carrier protein ThiS [Myroides pelagicus]
MELKINNQQVHVDSNVTNIQSLLDSIQPNKQNGIAVAINQVVIAKKNWSTFLLKENDTILIITATQGG